MNDINVEKTIKNHFSTMPNGGMLLIENMPEEYPAWIVKARGKVGVAIPYMGRKKFYAAFARAELQTEDLFGDGRYRLLLSMKADEAKDIILQFASVCTDFVRIGKNGAIREEISADPEIWWKKWRSLLGDSAHSQMVHAVVGELMVWRHLLQQGYKPRWTGGNKQRIDFVDGHKNWEVKSTTDRSKLQVTVHGQYQMSVKDGDSLQLVFCRLEESDQGESVNSLTESLKNRGVDDDFLEKELKSLGLREGSIARNRRFHPLEIRAYDVDEDFPAITAKSFVEGKFPAGIIKLDYTIDLANLKFSSWEDL